MPPFTVVHAKALPPLAGAQNRAVVSLCSTMDVLAFASCEDNSIHIVRWLTWEKVIVLPPPTKERIKALQWSPDGKHIAIQTIGGGLSLLHVESRRVWHLLPDLSDVGQGITASSRADRHAKRLQNQQEEEKERRREEAVKEAAVTVRWRNAPAAGLPPGEILLPITSRPSPSSSSAALVLGDHNKPRLIKRVRRALLEAGYRLEQHCHPHLYSHRHHLRGRSNNSTSNPADSLLLAWHYATSRARGSGTCHAMLGTVSSSSLSLPLPLPRAPKKAGAGEGRVWLGAGLGFLEQASGEKEEEEGEEGEGRADNSADDETSGATTTTTTTITTALVPSALTFDALARCASVLPPSLLPPPPLSAGDFLSSSAPAFAVMSAAAAAAASASAAADDVITSDERRKEAERAFEEAEEDLNRLISPVERAMFATSYGLHLHTNVAAGAAATMATDDEEQQQKEGGGASAADSMAAMTTAMLTSATTTTASISTLSISSGDKAYKRVRAEALASCCMHIPSTTTGAVPEQEAVAPVGEHYSEWERSRFTALAATPATSSLHSHSSNHASQAALPNASLSGGGITTDELGRRALMLPLLVADTNEGLSGSDASAADSSSSSVPTSSLLLSSATAGGTGLLPPPAVPQGCGDEPSVWQLHSPEVASCLTVTTTGHTAGHAALTLLQGTLPVASPALEQAMAVARAVNSPPANALLPPVVVPFEQNRLITASAATDGESAVAIAAKTSAGSSSGGEQGRSLVLSYSLAPRYSSAVLPSLHHSSSQLALADACGKHLLRSLWLMRREWKKVCGSLNKSLLALERRVLVDCTGGAVTSGNFFALLTPPSSGGGSFLPDSPAVAAAFESLSNAASQGTLEASFHLETAKYHYPHSLVPLALAELWRMQTVGTMTASVDDWLQLDVGGEKGLGQLLTTVEAGCSAVETIAVTHVARCSELLLVILPHLKEEERESQASAQITQAVKHLLALTTVLRSATAQAKAVYSALLLWLRSQFLYWDGFRRGISGGGPDGDNDDSTSATTARPGGAAGSGGAAPAPPDYPALIAEAMASKDELMVTALKTKQRQDQLQRARVRQPAPLASDMALVLTTLKPRPRPVAKAGGGSSFTTIDPAAYLRKPTVADEKQLAVSKTAGDTFAAAVAAVSSSSSSPFASSKAASGGGGGGGGGGLGSDDPLGLGLSFGFGADDGSPSTPVQKKKPAASTALPAPRRVPSALTDLEDVLEGLEEQHKKLKQLAAEKQGAGGGNGNNKAGGKKSSSSTAAANAAVDDPLGLGFGGIDGLGDEDNGGDDDEETRQGADAFAGGSEEGGEGEDTTMMVTARSHGAFLSPQGRQKKTKLQKKVVVEELTSIDSKGAHDPLLPFSVSAIIDDASVTLSLVRGEGGFAEEDNDNDNDNDDDSANTSVSLRSSSAFQVSKMARAFAPLAMVGGSHGDGDGDAGGDGGGHVPKHRSLSAQALSIVNRLHALYRQVVMMRKARERHSSSQDDNNSDDDKSHALLSASVAFPVVAPDDDADDEGSFGVEAAKTELHGAAAQFHASSLALSFIDDDLTRQQIEVEGEWPAPVPIPIPVEVQGEEEEEEEEVGEQELAEVDWSAGSHVSFFYLPALAIKALLSQQGQGLSRQHNSLGEGEGGAEGEGGGAMVVLRFPCDALALSSSSSSSTTPLPVGVAVIPLPKGVYPLASQAYAPLPGSKHASFAATTKAGTRFVNKPVNLGSGRASIVTLLQVAPDVGGLPPSLTSFASSGGTFLVSLLYRQLSYALATVQMGDGAGAGVAPSSSSSSSSSSAVAATVASLLARGVESETPGVASLSSLALAENIRVRQLSKASCGGPIADAAAILKESASGKLALRLPSPSSSSSSSGDEAAEAAVFLKGLDDIQLACRVVPGVSIEACAPRGLVTLAFFGAHDGDNGDGDGNNEALLGGPGAGGSRARLLVIDMEEDEEDPEAEQEQQEQAQEEEGGGGMEMEEEGEEE